MEKKIEIKERLEYACYFSAPNFFVFLRPIYDAKK
jgi:hypothetical protein